MVKKKLSISEEDFAAFNREVSIAARRLGVSEQELIENLDKWLKQEDRLAAPVAKQLGVPTSVVVDLWVAMRLASGRLLSRDKLSAIQAWGGISELEVRRVYRELRRRPLPPA